MEEITDEWRNLHNEDLYDFCFSPNTRIIRCIKSRELRWPGREARLVRREIAYVVSVKKIPQ
jgi:hypothetical protein